MRVPGAFEPTTPFCLKFTSIGLNVLACALESATPIPELPASTVVVSDHRIELIDMSVNVIVDCTPGTVKANVLGYAVANLR